MVAVWILLLLASVALSADNSLVLRLEQSWFNHPECGVDRIPLQALDFDDCFHHQTWQQRRDKIDLHQSLKNEPVEQAWGLPYGRIASGHEAAVGQFPWTVMINRTGYRNLCTGSLLNLRLVLTCAHCLFPEAGETTSVWIGVDPPERDRLIQVDVETLIPHPCYRYNNKFCPVEWQDTPYEFEFDVGFIVIKPIDIQKRDFYYRFNTICLPNYNRPFDNFDVFWISGWGQMLNDPVNNPSDSVISNRLQWLRVAFYVFDHRQNLLILDTSLLNGTTCQGDSGAPVVIQNSDGRFFQVAVYQGGYGKPCKRRLSEAVSILHPFIRPWINEVVNRTMI